MCVRERRACIVRLAASPSATETGSSAVQCPGKYISLEWNEWKNLSFIVWSNLIPTLRKSHFTTSQWSETFFGFVTASVGLHETDPNDFASHASGSTKDNVRSKMPQLAGWCVDVMMITSWRLLMQSRGDQWFLCHWSFCPGATSGIYTGQCARPRPFDGRGFKQSNRIFTIKQLHRDAPSVPKWQCWGHSQSDCCGGTLGYSQLRP